MDKMSDPVVSFVGAVDEDDVQDVFFFDRIFIDIGHFKRI